MTLAITDVVVRDIRFPTSRSLAGSDAIHPDPDYSAAYVVLHTNDSTGLEGHGLTFTLGRGNEVCVAGINALRSKLVGRTLESITADMCGFWRELTSDGQLRWLGPEKGVIHLATAALLNAVWDLYAKSKQQPLWRLLADMTPEQLVACIDFRYISDAITPNESIEILRQNEPGRDERIARLQEEGYPAYTTSAGWIGYSDAQIQELCREALDHGWSHFKIKVGLDVDDDMRRCSLIRDEIGPDRKLMTDANQVWSVQEAIDHMKHLARFDPWWIEEPTSPDDVLGHAAIRRAIKPIRVATGEQCQNRIVFKQFMQAGAMDFCQIDACRLGGVNEVLAVGLMAAKYGIPVCPHAGGVGLCEYVQHLGVFDYIGLSASLDDRVLEYTDHLHEHFVNPVTIRNGRYIPPIVPGYGPEIKPDALDAHEYPNGSAWRQA